MEQFDVPNDIVSLESTGYPERYPADIQPDI
jgi:hypothetical protein